MATVAYIRVSSIGQNTDRQLADESFDKVFTDKISAKDVNRPALTELIDYVRDGDVVVVHSIDRLARNLADLESLIEILTGKGTRVEFRKESLTFSGGSDAMQKLLLQMLGAVAEFERSLIRERQREGIAAAKQAGKTLGRPSGLSEIDIKRIQKLKKKGATIKELTDEFNVSRSTIWRACK